MADGKTEIPQPERVQKNVHLVPHAHRAVLQVAVIKAEAGIKDDFLHAAALREFNLARKIIAHHRDRVGAQIEVADFTNVLARDITDDDGGIVRGDQAILIFRFADPDAAIAHLQKAGINLLGSKELLKK